MTAADGPAEEATGSLGVGRLVRDRLVHLRRDGVSLVLDLSGVELPRVVHWGADLGPLTDEALEQLVLAGVPPVASNALGVPVPVAVLPAHASGWAGLPGLSGHREGEQWSPLFTVRSARLAAEGGLRIDAEDTVAGLALTIELNLDAAGVVAMRASLTNQHDELPYTLDALVLALPVPTEAAELLDFTGRHVRERAPQRQPFTLGSRVRDNRRGRTGADAAYVLAVGTEGFGFRSGEVWATHVGWSGNHRTYAERLPSGVALIGGGELLLPGEGRLPAGATYTSPWLYFVHGQGLDDVSRRFHTSLRDRPSHPRSPRPVVLNTWEAVYFDHDLARLVELADSAAAIGVERFVLDDGWFRHRRDDHAGLGDWYVDEGVWPDGLHPLVDHVRGLGMEFGLWVEPEMVNPDSDLARAHPEWIFSTGGRLPPESRFQQVLDLGHPGAHAYIFERLDALLDEYDIGYLKWDHNRDLVDAGHSPGGEAGVHRHTLAVYALMDQLKARHHGLEIESCSSGGARVDLGVLARTDRVWASDCNDALERQAIQRWTSLLIPLELIGAHVGPPRSHTTARTHDLSFRAGTALFGHFGIEWDISRASQAERDELTEWVALYKELRPLLHSGTYVRSDHPDPALWLHGVVAADRSEAVYAMVATASGVSSPPGRVRLPGLAPDRDYHLEAQPPGHRPAMSGHAQLPWLTAGSVTLGGRALGLVGVQAPAMYPEQLLLLRLRQLGP